MDRFALVAWVATDVDCPKVFRHNQIEIPTLYVLYGHRIARYTWGCTASAGQTRAALRFEWTRNLGETEMKMKRLSPFFGLLALAGAASARADSVAYTDPANQGTQAWQGNLALNFNVLSPISVAELGVFNASGSGTITGTIEVAIYNTVTNTQVTPVVTFHGNYTPAGLGFDVFQSITPVVLGIGSYEVDAVGFSGTDFNGNLNTGSSSGPILNDLAGSLAFSGASYDGSSVLDDPSTCSGCRLPPAQSRQFDAGTFSAGTVVTAVPEPGTMTLLCSGLIGLAVAFRRKSALARPN
jgi:hypothetical protein